MHNLGSTANTHSIYGGFPIASTIVYLSTNRESVSWPYESVESKLERRLKKVEKAMIKYPRRMDLKLEAIQIRKDLIAIKMKEKK